MLIDLELGILTIRKTLKPEEIIRGAVAQSVERATPGEEVPDSIHTVAAHSPLVGSVSV